MSWTAATTALAVGALVVSPGAASALGVGGPLQVGPLLSAPPTVLSVSPAEGSGSGGTKVTIVGEGLAGATEVHFGATAVTITKTSKSEKKLEITSPAGTGTVDVAVTTPNGTSEASPGDRFTYAAVPAPTITKVSPAHGYATKPRTVKLTGEALAGVTEVHFGAQSVPFTVAKPTLIDAMVPAGIALGTVEVTVTTPTGTSAVTSSTMYTFTGEKPALEGMVPTDGPAGGGNTVMLLGKGFFEASRVNFGNTLATFEVVSDDEIRAVAPPETSAKVAVWVTTPLGTSPTTCTQRRCTPPPHYTFDPPTVTSVSPDSGPVAGGTPITVTGTGFGTAFEETTIEIGHPDATSVHCLSTMECTALTPEGKHAGPEPLVVRIHSNLNEEDNHSEESPIAVFNYE